MKSKLITIREFKEILNNLSSDLKIRVYYDNEGGRTASMKKKNRYTLNQIGDLVVELAKDVKVLKHDVKSINVRLNYIVKANGLKDSSNKITE